MLRLAVTIHLFLHDLATRIERRWRDDRGQSTAEYALVLLGAAAVALLLVTWATKTNRISRLMDSVIDRVLSQVT